MTPGHFFVLKSPFPQDAQSRALESTGSRRWRKALPRDREERGVASKQFREVALFRGASGSCRRGLHYPFNFPAARDPAPFVGHDRTVVEGLPGKYAGIFVQEGFRDLIGN